MYSIMSSQHNNITQVVVGVLFNHQNQVLIAKRPLHKPYPGLWEFPGGKIEPNESPLAALHREFFEELCLKLPNDPKSNAIKAFHEITYIREPDYAVHLLVYKITEYIGEPIGAEGQEIKWVEQSDLINYEFPVANREIIEILTQTSSALTPTESSS